VANQLKREGKRNLVIVYHLLDSHIYMTKTEEGEYLPLKRDTTGRFHCNGELFVAPKELIEDKYRTIEEVICAERGLQKILVAPLVRYVNSGCCAEDTHCRNRAAPDYTMRLMDGLEKVRETLKGLLFRSNIKGAKTVAFNREIMAQGEKIWRGDRVHLTAEGYAMLAGRVREVSEATAGKYLPKGNISQAERKRRRESSEESSGTPRQNVRIRLGPPCESIQVETQSYGLDPERRVVVGGNSARRGGGPSLRGSYGNSGKRGHNFFTNPYNIPNRGGFRGNRWSRGKY